MALDKLVDSTQLGSDLTSVANKIRQKSGGSSSLAFPNGFVSEIGNISGGGNEPMVIKDYVVPSVKWTAQNCIPNTLKTGGCIHYIYTLQTNASTSDDKNILCFGVGALTSWTPGTASPSVYVNVERNSASIKFQLRGVGDVTLYLTNLADANGKFDVKFYSNKFVNVSTNTTTYYSDYNSAMANCFSALATANYLSIGVNQSNPFTGAVVTLFAFEEA